MRGKQEKLQKVNGLRLFSCLEASSIVIYEIFLKTISCIILSEKSLNNGGRRKSVWQETKKSYKRF